MPITDAFDNPYPPLAKRTGPVLTIRVKEKSGCWTFYDHTHDRAWALAQLKAAKLIYGKDNVTLTTDEI